jgi:deferrochelatase/peroxidase EfeB
VAHAAKPQSAPGTLSPDARMETQPFYGEHQAGILTPQQASMMLVAFDSLASDKADLERLFRLLTTHRVSDRRRPGAGYAEPASAADGLRHSRAVYRPG